MPKTDISSIHEQEFKSTVIRLLDGLEKSIEDSREILAAGIKDLKTSQSEVKDIITETQNRPAIITVRTEEVKKRIGDREDKIVESNKSEKKRERNLLDHESRLRYLSNSIKQNIISILIVPEKWEREIEDLFEQIIPETLPNLGKETFSPLKR